MDIRDINKIDVLEDEIYDIHPSLLKILLQDKSTKKNILWCTNDYIEYGFGFDEKSEIKASYITGFFSRVIQPRAAKPKAVQDSRIKKKAEVFTPSWICNEQNNLVDNAWFGRENIFNTPSMKSWVAVREKIRFEDNKKTWQKYVDTKRLEITCGEAPYLVSRYDTTTGVWLPIYSRIGLLDRKLRIVSENCVVEEEWFKWTVRAFQSVYGYEFQGDSVLIARENLLYTFRDYYKAKFDKTPTLDQMKIIANIIAWNVWQMDGMTCTVPYSCHSVVDNQQNLFEDIMEEEKCPGCEKNELTKHNGIYCIVKDWRDNSALKFVSMLTKGCKNGNV